MALADIVERIAADATREANEILLAAQDAAERSLTVVRADAAARREKILADTLERAEEGARTKLARARINARDRALAAKRELMGRVIGELTARLEALPPDEYTSLIAREVAGSIRGGEKLVIAKADHDRLMARLPAALAAADVQIDIAETPGEFARGVLVEGDRMRTEISPAAIVATRADELTSLAADVLFGGGAGADA